MKFNIKQIIKGLLKSLFVTLYFALIFSMFVGGIVTGIWTLIPTSLLGGYGASKPCYLGYVAHCSFSPYGTIILLGMALVGLVLLIKFAKYLKRKYKDFINSETKFKTMSPS